MEEAWLSELEMNRSENQILSHNFDDQEQYHQQNEDDMDTLNEELAAVLGEDFSLTNFNAESTTISSLLNSSTQTPNNLSDQFTISDQQLPTPSDNIVLIDDNDDHDYYQQVQDHPRTVKKGCKGSSISGEEIAAKTSGKRKRRDPEKVRGHIMAERKRRELLTQRFIALSAMIPDLKKIDKTTIIEAAIKHLGQVQERVKVLEEAAISKNNNEGSVIIAKKTQLVINIDDDNAIRNGSSSICSLGGSSYDDDDDGHQRDKLPDIEVKVTRKTLLLRICCARRKGILAKIYQQVENRNMTILNSNVLSFERSTFDITIIARMEVAEGHDKQLRDLVRTLHSVI